ATKHIDGQGRALGGAILGAKALLEEAYRDPIRHTGPALSPFNAWVLLNGLTTLDLRVRRQSETAAALPDHIADHPHPPLHDRGAAAGDRPDRRLGAAVGGAGRRRRLAARSHPGPGRRMS